MISNQPESFARAGNFSSGPAYPAGNGRFDVFLTDAKDEAAQKIGRSIAYMVENLNRPLLVATLAAQARVSPSHFFTLFKQHTGCPPMDYFTRLRVRRACDIFDSTPARVKEVAAALGYDDPFYFSRVFKSVSAMAPIRYCKLAPALRREVKGQIAKEMTDLLLPGDPPGRGHQLHF